jgi:hypothetical protein
MQREYHDVLFTKHAMERMRLRRITQDMVIAAIKKPDQKKLEDDGDTKFMRTLDDRPLHVVSTYLTDEKKWLVKSVWVRGEDDPQPLWKRLLSAIWGVFFKKSNNRKGHR